MAMGLMVTSLRPVLSNPGATVPSRAVSGAGEIQPVRNAEPALSATSAQSASEDLPVAEVKAKPTIQLTFGQYSGTGETREEALKPIQQASYHDIMSHEMAHYSQAGSLAIGGPNIQLNSDGIAVAGHVNIRLGGLDSNNPELSFANAHQAMCAACAPSDMSAQDQAVAANASQLMCQAQALMQQKTGWANLMASASQTAGDGPVSPGNPVLAGNRLSLSV